MLIVPRHNRTVQTLDVTALGVCRIILLGQLEQLICCAVVFVFVADYNFVHVSPRGSHSVQRTEPYLPWKALRHAPPGLREQGSGRAEPSPNLPWRPQRDGTGDNLRVRLRR